MTEFKVKYDPISLHIILDGNDENNFNRSFSSVEFHRKGETIKVSNERLFEKLKELFPDE